MINLKVRYFASMRDRMGRGEEAVSFSPGQVTVEDLWKKVSGGESLPSNTLVAVNMEYTDGKAVLKDGDEIAFFPPVTGG
jgi:molybdopterin synthase sulfur carrier subunit